MSHGARVFVALLLRKMEIRGNASVHYHTLSDFRVQNGEFLEQILVDWQQKTENNTRGESNRLVL